MEVKRTMMSQSVMEAERLSTMEFMVPMEIPGRHQLLTKMKDMIGTISDVVIKPIKTIPSTIKDCAGFFCSDGYYNGNFIAYGTNLNGKETMLWDDFTIPTIEHKDGVVITKFIKERLSSNNEIVIVTAKKQEEKVFSLELYYYLP